jgi:Cu2+-exporting ATPase
MAETLDFSSYARPRDDGAAELELAVDGVTCGACITRIETAVKRLPGVTDARLNFSNRRLNVAWADGEARPDEVLSTLAQLGYRGHPFKALKAEEQEAAQARWLMRCLSVAGFAAMNIMLLSVSVWSGNSTDITPETRDLFHWASALIALPAAAYAGQPFFQSAIRALRVRQLNMDVPISLGVLLALGMSVIETANHASHAYFDSAIMLLFFLLCGRYLDHALRRKTRAVAGNLAALKGEVAHRFEGNEITSIPAQAVKAGDRLLVRPGERIPADGVVLNGTSEVDDSLVTGETARRKVTAGETIYAGSMNYSGALILKVLAAEGRTLIDEVERLLEKAVAAKSKYTRLADRVARLYAPVVHVTAALTAAGWLLAGASLHDAVITAIAVLIITCPCALALAIPAVQVVASGTLFRAGTILNAADALERVADVDVVVFDKTGTLTLPEPRVANVTEIDPDLLEVAARLGLSSRHPLAAAVAHQARVRTPFDNVTEEPGQGIRAIVDGREARLGSAAFCGVAAPAAASADEATSVIAFLHGSRTAVFRIRQALRPDAVEVVKSLAAMGLDIRILSGDRPNAVLPVAEMLGVTSWQGGLKPADKIAAIEALKAEGKKILMVGDGINDAPALAAADVSISPIGAADVTQAHADAMFIGDRLRPVLDTITVARRARRLMKQNLALAIIYNAIAVPIAIAGFVTPLIAAASMSGSSILVTFNALRARRRLENVQPMSEIMFLPVCC